MRELQIQSPDQEDNLEEDMATRLQYSCLENPINRGGWQPQSIGLQRIRHVKWLSTHAAQFGSTGWAGPLCGVFSTPQGIKLVNIWTFLSPMCSLWIIQRLVILCPALNKYSREPLCRFLQLFLQNPLFSRPLPQNFHPKFLFDFPFLVFQLSKTIILCSGFLPLVHHPEIQIQSQSSPPLFPSSQVLYCLLFRIWSYPYIYIV